jgi:hypothetical protein
LLITAGTSWFLVITAFWDDFYRNHGYCYPVICRNVYRKNILGYLQILFCMLFTAGASGFLGNSCGPKPQEGTAFLQEITTSLDYYYLSVSATHPPLTMTLWS